jgi:circadian clock protein KaiC
MDEFSQNFSILNNESSLRVQTGIEKLDELLSGGLPINSTTLVSGTPGSGKSILCFHYLWEGLKNGEKCLYLTSDERVDNIIKQSKKLGFDFKQWITKDKIKFMYLDIDKSSIYKEIEQEIKIGKYSRVVLDSLTPVTEVPVWVTEVHEINPSESAIDINKYPAGSIPATRMHIRRIMNLLSKDNCTAMVTSEVLEGSRNLSRDTISEFIVDGIILLDLDPTMDRRKLTIRKMRATKHTLKPQNITIGEGGIKFV